MDHCPKAKKIAFSQRRSCGQEEESVIIITNRYGTMRAM
jgi:hypothetical protein